ncbi:MAG TPA: NUDIX hydrolase [Ktedonobacterales bacterium]|jgi:8-oxo-dGTP pyrophosphatase MutT (NUDIX family)
MSVEPRPAAAIVLLRDRQQGGIETFMVRRHVRSEFVPDVYVFPGGSVKPGDREAETLSDLCISPGGDHLGETALGPGLRAAAIRELFEEAGVLLAGQDGRILAISSGHAARFAEHRRHLQQNETTLAAVAQGEGLTLATDRLTYFAHWITPGALPKRFDTFFFIAAAPEEQQAAHDQLETTAGTWIAPGEALAQYKQGTFPLVFATIHQLRALGVFTSIADAEARLRNQSIPVILPRATLRDGNIVIRLPGEPGYDEMEA